MKPGQRQRLGVLDPDVFVVLDQQITPNRRSSLMAMAPLSVSDRQVDDEARRRPRRGWRAQRAAEGAHECAEITRPRPRPAPAGLLVTNGSNRRGRMSARMPGPLSLTREDDAAVVRVARARRSTRLRRRRASASIALRIRLTSTLLEARLVGHHGQVGRSHVDLDVDAALLQRAATSACASAMLRASGHRQRRSSLLWAKVLSCEVSRASRSTMPRDALQVAAHVVEPLVLEQDAGAVRQRAQRRQRLVQFVHHAGRHLAERRHLAGMDQLVLRGAQLGGARDAPSIRGCRAPPAAPPGWPALLDRSPALPPDQPPATQRCRRGPPSRR